MTRPAILPATSWPSKVGPHTVTFVRHGEKEGQGFYADLTPAGRSDSVDAGRRIGPKVDLFIASTSPRTMSTAECIRTGNGSSAPVIPDYQLANPGLGRYSGMRDALSSMFASIAEHIRENGSDVVVVTTHDYVVGYVAQFFGVHVPEMSEFLCGITLDLDLVLSISEPQ